MLTNRAPRTIETHPEDLQPEARDAATPAFVSIVMPALNEERYIAQAIRSVLPDPEKLTCELLVMDGGSTDATPQIVEDLACKDPRIKLMHNPGRLQSAAMNLAAREADPRAKTLIRADCHASYPPGYAVRLMETLREEGASSVVVCMKTKGKSCLQKAIAAAQNSRLGNGGSAHRLQGFRGFVEHGHHAAFNREAFLRTGGYDESCPYNEDAEFDFRLVRQGGSIFLNGDIAIDYYPRETFSGLSRQYANHGWGRANTILKHGAWPKLRQVAPLFILLAFVGAPILALMGYPLALLLPLAYLALVTVVGLGLARTANCRCTMMAGPAAAVMHLSWAAGFVKRVAAEGVRLLRRGGGGEGRAVPGVGA